MTGELMEKVDVSLLNFKSMSRDDIDFDYQVYFSTREEEMEKTGWTPQEVDSFMRMQFNLQHKQYTENYKGATFEIILVGKTQVGRLFLHKTETEIRIMDISLLKEFRGTGIGTKILSDLIKESGETGRTLSIHVEMINPAVNLYKRLGFQMVTTTGIYYLMERKPV
jgi:ribosomal protein S18 acetylase RimI-like enzyme